MIKNSLFFILKREIKKRESKSQKQRSISKGQGKSHKGNWTLKSRSRLATDSLPHTQKNITFLLLQNKTKKRNGKEKDQSRDTWDQLENHLV